VLYFSYMVWNVDASACSASLSRRRKMRALARRETSACPMPRRARSPSPTSCSSSSSVPSDSEDESDTSSDSDTSEYSSKSISNFSDTSELTDEFSKMEEDENDSTIYLSSDNSEVIITGNTIRFMNNLSEEFNLCYISQFINLPKLDNANALKLKEIWIADTGATTDSTN